MAKRNGRWGAKDGSGSVPSPPAGAELAALPAPAAADAGAVDGLLPDVADSTTSAPADAGVVAAADLAQAPISAAPDVDDPDALLPVVVRGLGLPRVIGIGASAGGIEALRALAETLPEGAMAAYVVVQHTAPDYRSTLASLLAPATDLEVVDLVDDTVPLAGTIYIAPASHDAILRDGRLRLVTPRTARGPHPSVDRLLHALAGELGDRAVGIILSGTGTDGAAGLRAIKAAGGVALVQDPESARHAGMPRSAIQIGGVDLVLTPADMGPALERLLGRGGLSAALAAAAIPEAPAEVARLVRVSTGFRLGDYKPATVQRRIARRMGLLGIASIEDYIARIRSDRSEAEALVRDTFISVTSFFRDEHAFAALRPSIERIVAAAAGVRVLRCWVPACATGEEAWTLAMLIENALGEQGGDGEYIVFATDVDEQALETGRRATYAASAIEAIPEPLRTLYIESIDGVTGTVRLRRGRVVFARQNVLEDPPFAHLDLISCRNLLIYLNPRVQRQLLRAFHFALRPGGVLFLGRAENADAEDSLFTIEDSGARIYTRGDGPGTLALAGQPGPLPRVESTRTGAHPRFANEEPVAVRAAEMLARRFAPATVVIDEQDRIVHLHGDLGPFLRFPQAPGDWNLFDLLKTGPRAELRALTWRCRREGSEANGSGWTLAMPGGDQAVTPQIARLDPTRPDLVTIAFLLTPVDPADGAAAKGRDDSMIVRELESELTSTRGHLHAVVEALETSNEELQALNEMLQATNEELQTSNEELQTSNEELLTVNEELQVKTAELEGAATDLNNIRESLSFPLIVVDCMLRLTSANRASLNIAAAETLVPGRSLAMIAWRIPLDGLLFAIEAVVRDGEPLSHLIRSPDGRCHNLTVMPYYGAQSRIGGALLLFEDVTEREAALAARDEIEGNFRDAMNSAPIGMWIRRLDGSVISTNPELQAMLGLDEAEIRARGWEHFFTPEDRERLNRGRLDVLEGRIDRFTGELRMVRGNGSAFWVNVSSSLVRGADGRPTGTFSQIQDVDQAKRARLQIDDLAEKMRLATENGRIGIWERRVDNDELFWDAGMRDLYALTEDHGPIAVSWWAGRVVAEDRPRVMAAIAATLAEGVPLEVEYRIIPIEGPIRHVTSRARLLRDADGGQDRLIGTTIDVTELRVLSERLSGENRALAIAMRENQARAEENRLLVEASAHGVIAVDGEGRIRSVNAAAEGLFGHDEASLLGQPIEVLVPASQRMGHVMMRSDVELPEHSVHPMARNREVQGLHADGTSIPIDVQLRRSVSTSEPGVVASIYDLRPRLAQERAMAQARDAAEAANRAKSNFIATMSHEIRTPMNVVFGMLELLARGDLGEDQRDFIRKAQFATRTLRQLIDDILDFSRIEARRLTLESEPFNLNDLINAVAEQIAGIMTEGKRGLELVVDLDPGLPATVIGDALRLQQVLLNLGSNAVKFTSRGTVTLSARIVHRLVSGKVGLEFAVSDTGIGIGTDKLSAIFESFTQAEASTTRRFGGSGLGLSISQRLVELMGGTIGVDSEVGHGSRFAFTVALGVPRVDPALPAAEDGEPGAAGLHVLIVDDDARGLAVLAGMAKELGWNVETYAGGSAALARLEAGAPCEVAFVDWRMPGIDGWQVAEAIRALGEGRPTIVALLTAFDMAEFRARALRDASPFDGQLSKPATLAVLQRLGAGIVRERARVRAEGRALPLPAPARENRLAGLRVLVAEDFVLNQELLRALLEAEGATVTIAGDGLRAVEAVLAEGAVFDIVLMDVQMPEMDGFEATQALRRCAGSGDLPVLAITANAQKSDRDRCLLAGMDDYLAKPIAIEDLVVKVRRLVDIPREALPHHTRALGRPRIAVRAESEGDWSIDGALLDTLTFDHAAQALARGSMGVLGHVDALAALVDTIEEALAAGDIERLRTASHTLAGAAGGLGANPLTELARRVSREGEPGAIPAGSEALVAVARASVAALRARAGS